MSPVLAVEVPGSVLAIGAGLVVLVLFVAGLLTGRRLRGPGPGTAQAPAAGELVSRRHLDELRERELEARRAADRAEDRAAAARATVGERAAETQEQLEEVDSATRAWTERQRALGNEDWLEQFEPYEPGSGVPRPGGVLPRRRGGPGGGDGDRG